MENTSLDPESVCSKVLGVLSTSGFETHPFKIGWYNEQVADVFRLPYDADTLAFIVISTPDMFEKAFKPFVCREKCDGVRDPIDECMIHHFSAIKQEFPGQNIEILHDFEMNHNRRPKILVQTAGHVAGACRYYQRKDVEPDPWEEKKKIFGVCVHPKYGGWFALRGVIIFSDLTYPDLEKKEPPDVVCDMASRQELLERFNDNWQDWSFRDIVPVSKKYSPEQMKYFGTSPKDRKKLIEEMKGGSDCGGGDEQREGS